MFKIKKYKIVVMKTPKIRGPNAYIEYNFAERFIY